MICKACRVGLHQACEQGECECGRRDPVEEIIEASNRLDEALADTVYSALMMAGSEVARMVTDGAGKDAVRQFIQQVLRTHRAIRC